MKIANAWRTAGKLVLALGVLAAIAVPAGCGSGGGDGTAGSGSGSGSGSAASKPAPVETADETAAAATDGDSGASSSGSGTDASTGTSAETITVRLYWVSAGENALGVERTLPYTQATGTAALNALFEGPTDAELTTWPAIGTAIPEGTELLGLTIANGVAKVDVSEEFASGGGTFSVTARIAQVVYTLTQFPSVQSVEFSIEGERVEVFSSEGLVLDGPQTPEDYWDLLPIDA